MQAIIEAKKLARATKLVDRAKVVGKHGMVAGTKIAANGAIELSGTNLATWARVRAGGRIEHDGGPNEIIADLQFSQLVKTITGDVTLETTAAGLRVNNATIPVLSLEDYPPFPELTERTPLLTMSGKEAKALIKRFAIMARKPSDTNRLALTGIFFRWSNGRLTIAATNSYRLLREEYAGPDNEGKILVPAAELKRFGPSIPAKSSVTFEFAVEPIPDRGPERFFVLSFDGAEIAIKGISEDYPDIDRVTPDVKWPDAVELELPVADFLASLVRAAPFTHPESDAITLELEPDGVILSANARGEFLETVSGQCRFLIDRAGEEYNPVPAINFRRRYLEEYLTNCTAETVKIILTEPEKAGRFESEGGGVYVCMPIRLEP